MVLVLVLVGEQYCSRVVPSVPSGRTTHCSNTADEPADRVLIKTFNHHVRFTGLIDSLWLLVVLFILHVMYDDLSRR